MQENSKADGVLLPVSTVALDYFFFFFSQVGCGSPPPYD